MLADLRFDTDGLIPVIVQEHNTNDVLLLAYMNSEALQHTLDTGLAHFWSRSRQKLWQKGETSGHVQEVVSLHLNCEGNSLLLRVRQRGEGACHDGYRSCYYRQLNDTGAWEITQPRLFDPAEVYQAQSSAREGGLRGAASSRDFNRQEPDTADALADAFQCIYSAYCYLRDHDLETVSGTSLRLRYPDLPWLRQRAGQELDELAGVLAGTHAHSNPIDDTILECRQVCYWLLVLAAAAQLSFETIAPHKQLRAGFDSGELLTPALAHEFARTLHYEEQTLLAELAQGLRLVGGACRQQGVSLLALAEAELEDLQQKSYLPSGLIPGIRPSS